MALAKLSSLCERNQELILGHVGRDTTLADTLKIEILGPTVIVNWVDMSLVLAKIRADTHLLLTPDLTCRVG